MKSNPVYWFRAIKVTGVPQGQGRNFHDSFYSSTLRQSKLLNQFTCGALVSLLARMFKP